MMPLLAEHSFVPVTVSASAEASINRGRQQLQNGDLPSAILTYRYGLLLHPTNRELQRDLVEARSLVAYPQDVPLPPDFQQWHYQIRESQLFAVFVALMVLTGFAAVKRYTTRPWWAGTVMAGGIAACLAVAGLAILLERQQRRERELPFAVVNQPCILRSGNGESYPPRLDSALPAGAEAVVLIVRGDWVQIELAGGIVGWVKHQTVHFSHLAQVYSRENIP